LAPGVGEKKLFEELMTQNKPCIERDEVKKLAHISQLAPTEAEIGEAATVLDARLSYITILQDLVADKSQQQPDQVVAHNVMRDDVVKVTDADSILALAPQSEAHYFVVPVIIKQNS